MVNDPFSDLPFFQVVKNPYDLRSHIRFWILPKNAANQSLFPNIVEPDIAKLFIAHEVLGITNYLKHGFFMVGKMSRESPVAHLNDRSNQMIDSSPTQKWFLLRSISSFSLASSFSQFHHNRCWPGPLPAAFAVMIMINSKFFCSTIIQVVNENSRTGVYKVMEYEIPFIQVLNNDHNNEQSILCRASASNGKYLQPGKIITCHLLKSASRTLPFF